MYRFDSEEMRAYRHPGKNQEAGSKTLIQPNRATRGRTAHTLYRPPRAPSLPANGPTQTSLVSGRKLAASNETQPSYGETLRNVLPGGEDGAGTLVCTWTTTVAANANVPSSPGGRRVCSVSRVRIVARYSGAVPTRGARNGDMALLGAIVRFDHVELSV